MSSWQTLLDRAVAGLDATGLSRGWSLGGGTALMIHLMHRTSKDIDIFVPDPQWLNQLSPRLGGEEVFGDIPYTSDGTGFLKLNYPEGEIDFIVGQRLTDEAVKPMRIGSHEVQVETPAEIAAKKIMYRGSSLQPRDVFDIAAVTATRPQEIPLIQKAVAGEGATILATLGRMDAGNVERTMARLPIFPGYRELVPSALERVRDLAKSIPERSFSMGRDAQPLSVTADNATTVAAMLREASAEDLQLQYRATMEAFGALPRAGRRRASDSMAAERYNHAITALCTEMNRRGIEVPQRTAPADRAASRQKNASKTKDGGREL